MISAGRMERDGMISAGRMVWEWGRGFNPGGRVGSAFPWAAWADMGGGRVSIRAAG